MRSIRVAVLILAAAAALTWACRAVTGRNLGGDFLCFWTAARLIVSGGNPYDPASQIAIQDPLGWDRQKMGFGLWDFLPFNYPPWVEVFALPLLPLGYVAAKSAWVGLSFVALIVAGRVLSSIEKDPPAWAGSALAALFVPATIAACQGQTSPQMLCSLAVALWALRRGRPGVAGTALAWSTIKPHLALIPVAAVLLWCARQRRWTAIGAFALTLLGLVLVFWLLVPGWPQRMLGAIRYSPVPTTVFPELGGTWPLVLRALGLRGPIYYAAWAALAIPLVVALGRSVWDRKARPDDVLALGVMAAFVVAPYGRVYDYALLILPMIEVARGGRGRLVVLILLVSAWAYLGYLPLINKNANIPGKGLKLYTFFWLPLVVMSAWFLARASRAAAGRQVADREIVTQKGN
jgi:hypothetical protein